MRWPLALLFILTLVAVGAGCHSCEKVERELHARDNDLRELRDELDRSECYNKTLQTELNSMRGDFSPFGGPGPGPGQGDGPAPLYPIRKLTLGRQTGGYDTSSCAGDTALQVVLEPRDCDNHSIKVPASALIQVVEITPEGLKKPLSSWEVSPEQLRCAWRQGLLTTGYVLLLPWKVFPSTPKLRVVVQMQIADGRVYEADKDVTVKLVPPAQRDLLAHPPERLPDSKEDPLLPMPEKLPAPMPSRGSPGPGPVLPPPAPTPGQDRTASGWGQTASVPSVQIDRPIAIRSGW